MTTGYDAATGGSRADIMMSSSGINIGTPAGPMIGRCAAVRCIKSAPHGWRISATGSPTLHGMVPSRSWKHCAGVIIGRLLQGVEDFASGRITNPAFTAMDRLGLKMMQENTHAT